MGERITRGLGGTGNVNLAGSRIVADGIVAGRILGESLTETHSIVGRGDGNEGVDPIYQALSQITGFPIEFILKCVNEYAEGDSTSPPWITARAMVTPIE